MNVIHIILPILLCSLIGYCTNYIAIKMLFHPYKAVYIGKYRLPFTPGIIPKNQSRMAHTVGNAVSNELLTREAVMENLGATVEKYLSRIVNGVFESETSIAELLPESVQGEELIDRVSTSLSDTVITKASELNFDPAIAQFVKDAIDPLLAKSPMLSILFSDEALNAISSRLGKSLHEYIDHRGHDAARNYIASYMKETASKPIRDLVPADLDPDTVKSSIESAIRKAAENHGADFLEEINVRGIVTDRIEGMEMAELEALAMSVMKKELQSVINLGALIGAIIGIVNIFI